MPCWRVQPSRPETPARLAIAAASGWVALKAGKVRFYLAALPAAAAPLLAPLQAMLEQHQYRQLCVLLESEGALAHT